MKSIVFLNLSISHGRADTFNLARNKIALLLLTTKLLCDEIPRFQVARPFYLNSKLLQFDILSGFNLDYSHVLFNRTLIPHNCNMLIFM